ncbi:hypothetical protein HMPREF1553_00735 [Porphyromonas gingivalis F0568]|nr:hypothetical protein [Porphyromonas gingivalis]ERJ69131.1 hypothetical protein HMPREF1553_00735 [Porphyromonas gingivalis F0568]
MSILLSTRHTKIFPFATPKNVARNFFVFGAANKKFSRRNEKVLVSFFRKTGARNE